MSKRNINNIYSYFNEEAKNELEKNINIYKDNLIKKSEQVKNESTVKNDNTITKTHVATANKALRNKIVAKKSILIMIAYIINDIGAIIVGLLFDLQEFQHNIYLLIGFLFFAIITIITAVIKYIDGWRE